MVGAAILPTRLTEVPADGLSLGPPSTSRPGAPDPGSAPCFRLAGKVAGSDGAVRYGTAARARLLGGSGIHGRQRGQSCEGAGRARIHRWKGRLLRLWPVRAAHPRRAETAGPRTDARGAAGRKHVRPA